MQTLGLFAILSAALFYLSSRALISRFLWSRYSPGMAIFVDCSACTGMWFGVGLSLTLGRYREPVFAPNTTIFGVVLEAACVGLSMIVLTPIVAGIMQRGFDWLGSAVTTEGDT